MNKEIKKIYYIVNARIPTEKAHGIQICKMCEAFSNIGMKLELWVPTRKNPIKEDTFSYYGLKKNFKIKYIKCFDFIKYKTRIGKICFYLQGLLFFMKLIFKKFDREAIIYTRTPEIAWLFKLKNYETVFEAHRWPETKDKLYKFLLKKVDKIICNSSGTEKKFKQNDFKNTLVAPNGVDINKYRLSQISSTNRHGLKRKLGLPTDKKIVMYVGHLYKWKGADVLVKAAETMADRKDIVFVLVGGTDKDIKRYKKIIQAKKLKNIILFGHQKQENIPVILGCADVLLLPNVPISQEAIEYSCPIKAFEYMASKKPIIASDLPSIREILNTENAILVKPGSVKALANAIKFALENPDFCAKISKQAHRDVQKYTWEKRAKRILEFIKVIQICG